MITFDDWNFFLNILFQTSIYTLLLFLLSSDIHKVINCMYVMLVTNKCSFFTVSI